MNEKKYLKWYQKIAYGSGDLASNCSYSLISSFMLIYLTNAIGLNSAVIGTLMMASKLLDGISDIFFGFLIDRTKTKLGKARPWMLFSQIGVSGCLFLLFCIPDMGTNMQYVYFFIFYTAFNAIFYTANNIAYSSLTVLITKNANERVQLGSIRFMFALAANMVIASISMGLVESLGGGTVGWRTVALIYAIIALAVNTISCLSVKELPEEGNDVAQKSEKSKESLSLSESAKALMSNKYYLLILAFYLCNYCTGGISQGAGIYFMTYYMGNAALLGTFSLMSMVPMVIALSVTPLLVKKMGSMWKINTLGYVLSTVMGVAFIISAYMRNIPLMLIISFIRGLCTGPMTGTLNALIAEASGYTWRTKKIHIDGTMFSCSSLGIKLGSGIGSAICGWLLALSGFDGLAEVQTQGALHMIFAMYVWIPVVISAVQTIIVYALKVEKANQEWDAAHAAEQEA